MRAFIEQIELYPEKRIDGNWIKKIVFNFPVPVEGGYVKELPLETESTVDVVGGGFILTKRTAAKETFGYDGIGTEWEVYSVEPFATAANGILDTDDFGAICNCAVRYAIGRRSYMPSIVCGFMKAAIRHLNEKTIGCMERDIREAEKYGWGYGDTCDYYEWMKLLKVIHKHMDENGIQRWP